MPDPNHTDPNQPDQNQTDLNLSGPLTPPDTIPEPATTDPTSSSDPGLQLPAPDCYSPTCTLFPETSPVPGAPSPVPAPESNPAPTPFDPEHPDPKIIRRCRSLTVRGVQCRQAALHGQDFCVQHFDRNPCALDRPGRITVPLLEDHSAIQLMLTRILHGVLNGQLDPVAAGRATAVCRAAALTLPRPAASARLLEGAHPDAEEAVPVISLDEAGNFIGPRLPWEGATGSRQDPACEMSCDSTFLPSHDPYAEAEDQPSSRHEPDAAASSLTLNASADPCPPGCGSITCNLSPVTSPEEPRTSNAERRPAPGAHLPAPGHVVNSVNPTTPLISNEPKSVPQKNHYNTQFNPPRRRARSTRNPNRKSRRSSLPLVSCDEHRARYYASSGS